LYEGQKIIETRNGSNAMVQQFIHGTQYIDELVMVRVKDKGEMFVHQAERDQGGSVKNWNVIGTTDMGRHVLEHNVLSPYGQLAVNQETGFGDRDGDSDVDSTDKGTVGVTCTGTVSGSCRILDLDFDGDYDSTDATKFDALPQGWQGREGLTASVVNQPFAHQGLLFEPEMGSYQNRARQYHPGLRRFVQRDPLVLATTKAGSGYQDGFSLYGLYRMNPWSFLDPLGTSCCDNEYNEWLVNCLQDYITCQQEADAEFVCDPSCDKNYDGCETRAVNWFQRCVPGVNCCTPGLPIPPLGEGCPTG
jgi:RHS repeat-associated protein